MKGTRQVNEILFIDSAYNYSIFGVRVSLYDQHPSFISSYKTRLI